jgi:hypothetical protein
MDWLSAISKFLPEAIVPLTAAIAMATVTTGIASWVSGRSKATDLSNETHEQFRNIPPEIAPHYALLREYHAQGLSQSRTSFWFSLIFAALGFAIIAYSIILFTEQENAGGSVLSNAGKPIFVLVAGTIIDAVSALFFVQSNKASDRRADFFDKLRIDRKLEESLKLVADISDTQINSNLRALLAINFAEIKMDKELYESVLLTRPTDIV